MTGRSAEPKTQVKAHETVVVLPVRPKPGSNASFRVTFLGVRANQSLELSVSLGTAASVSADGTAYYFDTLDTPEAYQALVSSFADNVVKRLD